MSRRDEHRTDPGTRVITGVCPHDCPDTCAWEVAVSRDDERALDLWGHPDHPLTAGRLCGKVDRYLERTYHPERLRTPLRREPGGALTPISWTQAIAEISARLRAIIDDPRHGPEAILPYSYGGTLGLLQGEGAASRLWHALGASQLARTICAEAGGWGHRYTTGRALGMDPLDFARARLVVIWGSNTLTSNMHLWPLITRARKQGARVIVIDPANTRTARAADEWIAIRPGTDAALALALMRVIIDEGLHDRDYVARHTVGFDALRERVRSWDPARAELITGVPQATITRLARDYATVRPAAIRVNYGLQRHRGGGMAVRAITCLPALIGSWRERGGGLLLSSSGSFHLDRRGLDRPDLLAARGGPPPRTFNMIRLGDALSLEPAIRARALYRPRPVDPTPTAADAGPPVQALLVYNCNPAAVAPDLAAVRRGLGRADLFTVVLEHFMTDTAALADYVLPATTQLEHWDAHKAYGHLYFALNRPAIPPVGESLPNSEIFRRLARALGLRDPCFDEDDETILERFVAAQTHESFASITWARLLENGFARLALPEPYLPFAEGGFPTPSGKCEFYSQTMQDDGYEPVPDYTPPAYEAVTRGDPGALCCISPPAHSFLNSSFVNVERLRRRERAPCLLIHPEDAGPRRVVDGASVVVESSVGRVELPARVTSDVVRGTVLAPGIWWTRDTPDGRGVNELTPQDETDMGGGAVFYDIAVRVRPA
ncbi:MAG: molybdopterin-dependent oxidoreductase [Myxococcales bacterium]|nr:molybdopterin-dependent oxidoreductase [Myxococcales bacterium]MCB9750863.1 molybdopterin-dependent oxidoreductase [Myxococcales bacterium]